MNARIVTVYNIFCQDEYERLPIPLFRFGSFKQFLLHGLPDLGDRLLRRPFPFEARGPQSLDVKKLREPLEAEGIRLRVREDRTVGFILFKRTFGRSEFRCGNVFRIIQEHIGAGRISFS